MTVSRLLEILTSIFLTGSALADSGHQRRSEAPSAGSHQPTDTVNRTIEVDAYDTMRFSIDDLYVAPGETIRFVVTNKGRLPHEFSIGTIEDQRKHAAMMKDNSHQRHTEPNAIMVEPRQTKELIWQFTGQGVVEIACMVPGHYEAGMIIPLKWSSRSTRNKQ